MRDVARACVTVLARCSLWKTKKEIKARQSRIRDEVKAGDKRQVGDEGEKGNGGVDEKYKKRWEKAQQR